MRVSSKASILSCVFLLGVCAVSGQETVNLEALPVADSTVDASFAIDNEDNTVLYSASAEPTDPATGMKQTVSYSSSGETRGHHATPVATPYVPEADAEVVVEAELHTDATPVETEAEADSTPVEAEAEAEVILEADAMPETASVPVERSVDAVLDVVQGLLTHKTAGKEIPVPEEEEDEEFLEETIVEEQEERPVEIVNGFLGKRPAQAVTTTPEVPKGFEAISDFNVELYTGTWYEQASSLRAKFFQKGCECSQATYSLLEKRNKRKEKKLRGRHSKKSSRRAQRPDVYIEVHNECYKSSKKDGYTDMTVFALPVSPAVTTDPLTLEDARLQVQFFGGKPSTPKEGTEGNYWVVAVDTTTVDGEVIYDNAIVVGPPSKEDVRMLPIWFLTREREVPEATVEAMRRAAIAAGLTSESVNEPAFTRSIQHSECDVLLA